MVGSEGHCPSLLDVQNTKRIKMQPGDSQIPPAQRPSLKYHEISTLLMCTSHIISPCIKSPACGSCTTSRKSCPDSHATNISHSSVETKRLKPPVSWRNPFSTCGFSFLGPSSQVCLSKAPYFYWTIPYIPLVIGEKPPCFYMMALLSWG